MKFYSAGRIRGILFLSLVMVMLMFGIIDKCTNDPETTPTTHRVHDRQTRR